MKTSKNGIELIKCFESFSSKACKCLATEKYYTIGYGHYGADVKENQTITKVQAEELLEKDLEKFEQKVNKYNNVYNFNQNQFDALVSFCYNVGNIDQLTAKGTRTIKEISEKILAYNKSGGKVINGLTNRRKKEHELFNTSCMYYTKYIGNSTNLDMILKSVGVEDKYLHFPSRRKPLAKKNGLKNYKGSLSENMKLIELAKQGKLKRV